MKRIIFAGAGMAALVAAEKIARDGRYEVVVFERETVDNLSYDWHDDVNRAAFLDGGLPLPREGTYFTKGNWSFIPPSERVEVTLDIPKDKLDWSIERRALAQQYVDRAKDVVDFRFGTPVESLIIEDGKVKGVRYEGGEMRADLVVDNTGAMSKLRASLGEGSGVTAMPSVDEIFVAYRGFHKKQEGAQEPQNTNRAYLKHLGEMGISWSIKDPSGTVNVLIGRVGKLPKEQLTSAYRALKASNPQISDEIVRGGKICVIPIRYPLTRFATDGYVAIGDSAFMTIPMIGSGIENSINAALILADVILNDGVEKEALWQYQTRYFLSRGANHMGVDVLKRWLLSAKPADIDWLFEKGVISKDDMAKAATGQLINLTARDLVEKATNGISRLPLLLKLNGVLNKTKRAARLGRAIPKTYDPAKIAAWQKKVEKLYAQK